MSECAEGYGHGGRACKNPFCWLRDRDDPVRVAAMRDKDMLELRDKNARLEAEAQALREEVARGNRITISMALDIAAVGEVLGIPGEQQEGGTGEFIDLIRELQEEVAALRARVVVVVPAARDVDASDDPEYRASATGYNVACSDVARLNGKAVSEGLLRDLLTFVDNSFHGTDALVLMDKLRALLGEGKESSAHDRG